MGLSCRWPLFSFSTQKTHPKRVRKNAAFRIRTIPSAQESHLLGVVRGTALADCGGRRAPAFTAGVELHQPSKHIHFFGSLYGIRFSANVWSGRLLFSSDPLHRERPTTYRSGLLLFDPDLLHGESPADAENTRDAIDSVPFCCRARRTVRRRTLCTSRIGNEGMRQNSR